MYEKLDVKHEPLSLIPPEFVCPFPRLQPAFFHPNMADLPLPALDLFDLDEQFASDEIRLAQLTNKCQDDDDLEYYILEAADILGVNGMNGYDGDQNTEDAKSVLDYIFRRIVEYKMRPAV
jgi:intraflagellar transport protein 52